MIDQIWANEAIKQCIDLGVDHFFLAPGSRCTPLTLAVAKNKDAKVHQHFDERGLAFAALGYARATQKPGVFICTSGTAVANAYPAVIEAAMECVPLLLFTADRPPELRGTGANQTIEQRDIFGKYPRFFFDMPVPEDHVKLDAESLAVDSEEDQLGRQFVTLKIIESISAARSGPAHLNWKFREPFTIDDKSELEQRLKHADRNYAHVVSKLAEATIVVTELDRVSPDEPRPTVDLNVGRIEERQRRRPGDADLQPSTLIVLGGCHPEEAASALELATQLNCPILSDITSGVRTGSPDIPSQFDLPKPDTILHIGDRIVSKGWLKWTAQFANEQPNRTRFLHLTSTGQTLNPHHFPVEQHVIPLTDLTSVVRGTATSDEFLDAWSVKIQRRDHVLVATLDSVDKLSEPAVAHHLGACLPTDHALFLGNSTPIRDMDWFSRWSPTIIRHVAANRGASGIDGLIATAVGYANGLQRPTTLLLGDLSALHDLNSLALVKNSRVPITVLVINNQGGHIFDLLPVATQTKHFERYFNTPHGFAFEHAAAMFGLPYQRASDMPTFVATFDKATGSETSTVIEVTTNRQYNMEVRRHVQAEIQRCSQN